MDAKSRLSAYLQEQLDRRRRMEDPAYRKSVNDDMTGAADANSRNNLAALLMDSASMAGSVGGKRADASGMARHAQAQNAGMNDFVRRMEAERGDRENRYQMDAKVHEYLAAKQQAQEDRAAEAKYRNDTLSQNKSIADTRAKAEAEKARRDEEHRRQQLGMEGAKLGLERDKMSQNAQLEREKIAAGAAKADDKPATEGQLGAANFGRKAQDADSIIDQIEKQGYDPATWGRKARNMELPLIGGKPAANEQDRSYEQAQKEFIAAILRKESGGAITPEEFSEYGTIYFPQPGDTGSVRLQKAARRKAAADNLIQMAGKKAAEQIKNQPFTVAPPKTGSGTAVAAPEAPGMPSPPSANEKVVDGVKYRKVPGGWEEVE